MKNKTLLVVLIVCMVTVFTTCKTFSGSGNPPKEITRNGYFTLKESNENGIYGPVYIFPETHDSRLIQAQVALAMDILYEQKKINSIALEGMYAGEVLTSEKMQYRTNIEKYNVLLALFERGDIKAPELMYLAKDSYVFGIEKESEHSIKPPSDDAYNALDNYLLMSILSDHGKETYESFEKELALTIEDEKEILDLFEKYSPWVKETIEIINNGTSVEINNRLSELNKKITPVSFLLTQKINTDFKQFQKFYETAHKRSLTMANSVLNVLKNKNEPLAMIIGANHTEEIIKEFEKNMIKYYVMEPRGLYNYDIWSNLSNYKYNQRNEGLPLFENKEIAQFFFGTWNSRPVITKAWLKKEESLGYLFKRMIHLTVSEQNTGYFTINGLNVVQNKLNESNSDDIKFCVENEREEQLFVRALRNPNMNRFGSFRKALQEMIARLYEIDKNNPPVEERMKAFNGVIETFNIGTYAVFISPSEDVLNFNSAILW